MAEGWLEKIVNTIKKENKVVFFPFGGAPRDSKRVREACGRHLAACLAKVAVN
jgi:hypothetical protein